MPDMNFFLTKMPPSRPADFYLGFDEGSVFLDFGNIEKNRIRLIRISFDGYGCCELGSRAEPLTAGDSMLFKEIIQSGISDQALLLTIVKRVLKLNANLIWQDALEQCGLI